MPETNNCNTAKKQTKKTLILSYIRGASTTLALKKDSQCFVKSALHTSSFKYVPLVLC